MSKGEKQYNASETLAERMNKSIHFLSPLNHSPSPHSSPRCEATPLRTAFYSRVGLSRAKLGVVDLFRTRNRQEQPCSHHPLALAAILPVDQHQEGRKRGLTRRQKTPKPYKFKLGNDLEQELKNNPDNSRPQDDKINTSNSPS